MKDVLDSATVASGSSNLVKLVVGDDKIVVTSNSKETDADFHGEVSAMTEGEGLSISFNLKYLIQAFNHVLSEKCVMHMVTPVSPCIISDKTDGTVPDKHLILPVRTFA